MMPRATNPHPDQFDLTLPDPALIERLVEERLARRCEAESFLWRFRLIAVETCVMGSLVLVAGLTLKQPTMMVVRASVLVAASCFATGMIMLLLSAWTVRMMARVRKWWRR